MKKELKIFYFWTVIRVILGAMFIYASLYKIASPGDFAHQIYNYQIVPVWMINPMAVVLPWLQFFCGLAWVLGVFGRGAGFWLAGMMIVFQMAVASALVRGLDVACGCFEAGGSAATWWIFFRDTTILILVMGAFWNELRPQKEGLWWRHGNH
jgi:hypothetical protein